MEVNKTQFDEALSKLLKAKPLPKSAIPRKARQIEDQPKQPDQSKSSGQ
jgi:hypothetical protein